LRRKKQQGSKELENRRNGGSLVQNYKFQCKFLIIIKIIITFTFKHCDISENAGQITEVYKRIFKTVATRKPHIKKLHTYIFIS
jgi:hypothetical protein